MTAFKVKKYFFIKISYIFTQLVFIIYGIREIITKSFIGLEIINFWLIIFLLSCSLSAMNFILINHELDNKIYIFNSIKGKR